ncbi:MAG: tRNA (adenosine(37)-N6)-threonylcarbamoyltransferase complex dimerization subunit type 1 TsaB [Gemmatimonadaceae bacterium]
MHRRALALAIEASTYAGSVALLREGRVLAERTVAMRGADSERLLPAVADALTELDASVTDVTLVIAGAGPGSFTSLRIAASIAKGVAAAREVPLHAVSSLLLLAAPALAAGPGRYLSVLDALRGEVYVAAFARATGQRVEVLCDTRLVARDEVPMLAAELSAVVIGAELGSDAAPHARSVAVLGSLGVAFPRVDIERWEPSYGRLAEAQVRWESDRGEKLPVR